MDTLCIQADVYLFFNRIGSRAYTLVMDVSDKKAGPIFLPVSVSQSEAADAGREVRWANRVH